MAERLRRKIRNLLGFSRAGSSPAGVVTFLNQYFLLAYMIGALLMLCTLTVHSVRQYHYLDSLIETNSFEILCL